jgi:hypothetical protein
MENTSGIIKPEGGDESRLNQPDNYNYNGPEVNYFDPVLENETEKEHSREANLSQISILLENSMFFRSLCRPK